MRTTVRLRWWLPGILAGLVAVAPAGAAGEEPLRAGTLELGLKAGYAVSHGHGNPREEDVDAFHALPHLGYVVTNEHGPAWLRGNLEVLAEPTIVRFEAETSSVTAGGLSVLGRWLFAPGGRVRPFVEAGVGLLVGDFNLRQTDCDVNYVLQGGPGLLVRVGERAALTVGYRFHHVSNADSCQNNLGLNSSLFVLGFSVFLP